MSDTADLGEIVVVAPRPRKMQDIGYEQPEEVSENPDSGSGGGAVYLTDIEVRAEEQRQRDCAGMAFHNQLQSTSSKDSKESFSFVLNRNGSTVYTTLATAAGPTIQPADRAVVISAQNIQYSEVEGFAHNHPNSYYCNRPEYSFQEKNYATDVNSYPSVNDWNFADAIVALHPELADKFTLYITGCDNVMRSYPYSNRAYYRQQLDRLNPPRQPGLQVNC